MSVAKQEEKKKLALEVDYCIQKKDDISLNLNLEDHHIGFTAFSWNHKPGYRGQVTIHDLTPDDVATLGTAILEASFRVKQEQEASEKAKA
jgi:hypothetical protein